MFVYKGCDLELFEWSHIAMSVGYHHRLKRAGIRESVAHVHLQRCKVSTSDIKIVSLMK